MERACNGYRWLSSSVNLKAERSSTVLATSQCQGNIIPLSRFLARTHPLLYYNPSTQRRGEFIPSAPGLALIVSRKCLTSL